MKAGWLRFVALLETREEGDAIACFRIAVGAVVLYSIVSVIAADLHGELWIDIAHGGMRHAESGSWILELLGGPRPEVVRPLIPVALGAALALVLGVGGRLAPLATLLSYRALSSIGHVHGGYDSMIFNALWLLTLADASATWSVDCRRREGRWRSARTIAAWPRYLVVFQLVVIYFFTGIQKTSASWTPADGYSALYWFLQDPNWVRFDMAWTASVYPLTQAGTAAAWLFEVGAPLLLLVFHVRATPERGGRWRAWMRRHDLRRPFAAFGISMHLAIAVLLNMGPFSWISIAYYACLWTPREWQAAGRRVTALTRRGQRI